MDVFTDTLDKIAGKGDVSKHENEFKKKKKPLKMGK